MPDACGDCLRQLVCEVTGASCPKLDALIQKLDDSKNQEGDTTMSNNAKNTATPKTVAQAVAAEKNAEDATVPAQATAEPKVEDVVDTKNAEGDATDGKKTVVQTLKAKLETLKKNKNAVIAIGLAAALTGVVINNKRRAAALKTDDATDVVEDTQVHQVGEDDATDDSV